jgi:hypothetical protein
MDQEVKKLQEIQVSFSDLRRSWAEMLEFNPNPSRETLATMENRFCELQADLASIIPLFFKHRTLHDDKRSTATKAELAHIIHQEEKSFAKSESLAAASDAYKKFLDDRSEYYMLYETVGQLQSSIQNYLTAIAHRFKIREDVSNSLM